MLKLDTIPKLLDHICQKYRDLDSFIDYDPKHKTQSKITYHDLPLHITSFQNLLPENCSRIVIYLSSNTKWLKIFFAIVCSGRIAILVDGNLEPEKILLQIKQSKADLIITDNSRLEKIKAVNIINELPQILNISNQEGCLSSGLIAINPFDYNNITEETIAVIIYTSGSTGNPKGIVLSHLALCTSTIANIECISYGNEGFNSLVVLPLWHILGLANAVLTLMFKGCRLYFIQTMKPNHIISTLNECKIYHLGVTPAFCEMIYKKINQGIEELPWYKKLLIKLLHKICFYLLYVSQRLSHKIANILFKFLRKKVAEDFEFIISGGARLNPQIVLNLLSFGYIVIQGYGLSEVCGGVTFTKPFDYAANCVGVLNDDCKVTIINENENGVGEICIKTKQLMNGYLNQPELTKEVYTEDGWFKTGDLGYLDKESRLYICGRLKDIIVTSAGKNIYPDDIEHYFSHDIDIDEVCVYGEQNLDGEDLVMIIKPSPLLEDSKAKAQLLKKIQEQNLTHPSYHQVQKIIFTEDDLPRTPAKKIDRNKVRLNFMKLVK